MGSTGGKLKRAFESLSFSMASEEEGGLWSPTLEETFRDAVAKKKKNHNNNNKKWK